MTVPKPNSVLSRVPFSTPSVAAMARCAAVIRSSGDWAWVCASTTSRITSSRAFAGSISSARSRDSAARTPLRSKIPPGPKRQVKPTATSSKSPNFPDSRPRPAPRPPRKSCAPTLGTSEPLLVPFCSSLADSRSVADRKRAGRSCEVSRAAARPAISSGKNVRS